MSDHEREYCGECMRDFLKVGMTRVTSSGIYLCAACYEADPLRGDDGLWIDDDEPDACPHCDGTGWQDCGVVSIECPECGGDGF